MEAEFGVASGSNKSLKTAQTHLGPPELQNLDADELESDEDDAASVASEQFYENIVSYYPFLILWLWWSIICIYVAVTFVDPDVSTVCH